MPNKITLWGSVGGGALFNLVSDLKTTLSADYNLKPPLPILSTPVPPATHSFCRDIRHHQTRVPSSFFLQSCRLPESASIISSCCNERSSSCLRLHFPAPAPHWTLSFLPLQETSFWRPGFLTMPSSSSALNVLQISSVFKKKRQRKHCASTQNGFLSTPLSQLSFDLFLPCSYRLFRRAVHSVTKSVSPDNFTAFLVSLLPLMFHGTWTVFPVTTRL